MDKDLLIMKWDEYGVTLNFEIPPQKCLADAMDYAFELLEKINVKLPPELGLVDWIMFDEREVT